MQNSDIYGCGARQNFNVFVFTATSVPDDRIYDCLLRDVVHSDAKKKVFIFCSIFFSDLLKR